jgi:hypothetical protein
MLHQRPFHVLRCSGLAAQVPPASYTTSRSPTCGWRAGVKVRAQLQAGCSLLTVSPCFLQVRDALGPQVESTKGNPSKPTFGSGTRTQLEKVYQDAESEKTYYGRLSPGPCAYDSKVRCMRPVLPRCAVNLHCTATFASEAATASCRHAYRVSGAQHC